MRARDFMHRIASLWEASQVELTGQYSVERFAELTAFTSNRSLIRAILWCVLTPVPCILVLLLVDAAPLEPPSNGFLDSPIYKTREYFITLLLTLSGLEQCRQHLPQLRLSPRAVVCISFLATTVGFTNNAFLSMVIGNPLPFAMVLGAPAWLMTLVACVYWLCGPSLRNEVESQKDLFAYVIFAQLRMSLIIIYPAYMFGFVSLHGNAQSTFVLVLPVLKVAAKFFMAKTLRRNDDIKPVAVVFNADVFHALFVSYSMQNATSFGSTLLIMCIDVGHAWLTVRDVDNLSNEILQAAEATRTHEPQYGEPSGAAEKVCILRLAESILEQNHSVINDPSIRRSTWRKTTVNMLATITPSAAAPHLDHLPRLTLPVFTTKIAPEPSVVDPHTTPPNPPSCSARLRKDCVDDTVARAESVRVVKQTLKLLYVTEFIVLMEYIEIVVPVIFSAYMTAMFRLPNRAYYPMLRSMSDDKIRQSVVNVLIYALLELVSLIGVSVVLWRKLRLSAVRQLAYVLETQWIIVQCALVYWVLYVVETTLEHFGSDYTFQFAWLKQHAP